MARSSRSAKCLVIFSLAAIALIGMVGWWRADNARIPGVTIPQPALPSPNAYDSYVAAVHHFTPVSNPLESDTAQFEKEGLTTFSPHVSFPNFKEQW